MRKFNDELRKVYEMATNEQKQKDYNDEMARKTLKYQKRMGFEVNQKIGNFR